MNKLPYISIITVVYNASELLEKTIDSIKKQEYPFIEYIIIDGKSKDGTLEVIHRNEAFISKWISEPDKSLYDAMNKGIDIATGDYLWFINAGDEIQDKETLYKIFRNEDSLKDIYYGQTMIIDKNGNEIGLRRLKAPEVLELDSLINGMLVCHQSFIVKRKISPHYDLKYKIVSDYDWMIKCLKSSETIQNTHMILSRFLDGGINKKNVPLALKERFGVMRKTYGFFRVFFMHFLIVWRFIVFLIKNKRF